MEELKKERDRILNRIGYLSAYIEELEGGRAILSNEFIDINNQIIEVKEEEAEKTKKLEERTELLECGDLTRLHKEYRRLNCIIDRHRKGIGAIGNAHAQRREIYEKITELENEND